MSGLTMPRRVRIPTEAARRPPPANTGGGGFSCFSALEPETASKKARPEVRPPALIGLAAVP
ncbi:hypothetical protein [Azospirillum agricola]|uniref:hypothetical protein n=1 Tax=Azospirillum agricola TaxID=1720247 RepID=UPI000A1CC3D8|nr:hypothetical protein [Azospirillum agricola]